MSILWSPPPIDILFEQLKSYMKVIAKGNDPVASTSTVHTGSLTTEANIPFPVDCK